MPAPKIAKVIDRDNKGGNLPRFNKSATNILDPMKTSKIANDTFRYLNLSIIAARAKYKARKPNIAKIFDVNTMNGSVCNSKNCWN